LKISELEKITITQTGIISNLENEIIQNNETIEDKDKLIGICEDENKTLSKEIRNFIDDGTCPEGWGTARHDQPLFSIFVQKLGYKILKHDRDNEECLLSYDGKTEPFHVVHFASRIKPDTNVFHCRRSITQETFNDNVRFIKFK
jgi:hypothetical protein